MDKKIFAMIGGMLGGFVTSCYGGWTSGMTTLLIFMAIDYTTGLIVAGVFHRSSKSENGRLESNACWKGLIKKVVTLILVGVAHGIDLEIGTTYLRDACTIAFLFSEALSIIENAGLMGIPIPSKLRNAIEVLKDK